MLSVKQAAARASVCDKLVRGWVADGRLPHYRLGAAGRRGKILIAEADLDALLLSFKVEAGDLSATPSPVPPAPKPVYKHIRV